ncbi:MAG: LPD7 domain-containing protein [Dokdonella sp.]
MDARQHADEKAQRLLRLFTPDETDELAEDPDAAPAVSSVPVNVQAVVGEFTMDDPTGVPSAQADEIQATAQQQREVDATVAAHLEKLRKASLWPSRKRADEAAAPEGFIGVPAPLSKHILYFHVNAASRLSPAFEDRGRRVVVVENSQEAILGAMRAAAAKWGAFRANGDAQFMQTCAELASKHGIRLTNVELQPAKAQQGGQAPAQVAASPTALPIRPKQSGEPLEALGGERPVPSAAPVGIPAQSARTRTFLRDLMIDAGFNLAQIPVTWTSDRAITVGDLSTVDLDRIVELCRRAGVDSLEHSGASVDIAAASAGRAVLQDVARRAMAPEAPASAVRVCGYALGRYLNELSTPWEEQAGVLLPSGLLELVTSRDDYKTAFSDGMKGAGAASVDAEESPAEENMATSTRFGP